MRPGVATLMFLAAGFLVGCKEKENIFASNETPVPREAQFAVSVEDSGSPEVDDLVRQLVSEKPPAYPSGSTHFYSNQSVSLKTEAAFEKLKGMGPAIFPALVKHMGDDRYSYSRVVQAWMNITVGDSVIELLSNFDDSGSWYLFREGPGGKSFSYPSFRDYLCAQGPDDWATWAKNKTMEEIGIAFIDWCIGFENRRGYISAAQKEEILKKYEDNRQRLRRTSSNGQH
jgi:hypothetical protein